MKKKIWRDYCSIWHFKRIKSEYRESTNVTTIWLLCYLFFLYPCLIMGAAWDWGVIELAQYFCYMIPVLLEMFSAKMMPMGLPKVAYLVPMSAKDRKKYVCGMYWLKVAVPLMIVFAAMLLLTVFSYFRWRDLVFGIILQFLMALVVQLTAEYLPAEQRQGKLEHVSGWTVFTIGSSVFILCIGVYICEVNSAAYDWILAAMVIWQLVLTIKCMSYYSHLVESCLFYENTVGREKRTNSSWFGGIRGGF